MKINLKQPVMGDPAEAAAREAIKRAERKFDSTSSEDRLLRSLVRSACTAAHLNAVNGGVVGSGSAASRGVLVTAEMLSRSQWTVCVYAKQI